MRKALQAQLLLVGVGAACGLAPAGAFAEPALRGAKAKVVQGPASPVQNQTGYYVPYVIGPGGRKVPIMEIPGSVTIVPRQLLDDQQATTLGEALRYVGGVSVGR